VHIKKFPQTRSQGVKKNRPKCSPNRFLCHNQYKSFSVEKNVAKHWTLSVLFIKLPKENNRPNLVTLREAFRKKMLLSFDCLFIYSLSDLFRVVNNDKITGESAPTKDEMASGLPDGIFSIPKIPIWVIFGRSCNGRCLYIIGPFGIPILRLFDIV
jgi:hypothetical protein